MEPPDNSIRHLKGRHCDKPALVIGNGESRNQFDLDRLIDGVLTFGCNAIYRDFDPDYIGAVDPNMTTEIVKSSYTGNVVYPINRATHYKRVRDDLNLILFDVVNGWSTGPTMVYSAALMGCNPIYLMGFDMGWTPYSDKLMNNFYKDTPNYRGSTVPQTHWANWVVQFKRIFADFPDCTFMQLGRHTFEDVGIPLAQPGQIFVSPEGVRSA